MADPNRDEDMLIVRTREAHEAIKDLKTVLRQIQDVVEEAERARERLLAMIAIGVATQVDDKIDQAISTGLENYVGAIESAIHDAEDHVYQRFEGLQQWLTEQLREAQPEEVKTWLQDQDLPDLLRSDRIRRTK